ncbi:MAG: alkaline phosphatase D family protein [Myxococcota bacterium]|nr:alkaline phosphatase D family protein [Myxococcota bacterium]
MSSNTFTGLDRRQFLGALLSSAACAGTEKVDMCEASPAIQPLEDGTHLEEPSFAANPFTLGVASGEPLPDRVILWTRLAPEPLAEDGMGGMSQDPVPVSWEIASDREFGDIVGAGVVATRPELAHAVHIDADGLMPNSTYYYRFSSGSWFSSIGKTRTTPCLGEESRSLRLAVLTCQNWEDGFFTVLADVPKQDPDLVLHVGDYIYEYGPREIVRSQTQARISNLAGYRRRFGLYKGDASLQEAHATCPWLVVWDDHEISNNYNGSEFYFQLRSEAYQAYYEHMPLRLPPPSGPDVTMYRTFQWGDLAHFSILDTRQYRSVQACSDAPDCPDINDETRTMLGAEQEAWLFRELVNTNTIWNCIAQQVVMANFAILFNYDQWDGYPYARKKLIEYIYDQGLENVLVFTGDVHIGGLARLNLDLDDFSSPIVAYECVTPSVTSDSRELMSAGASIEGLMMMQEHVDYIQATRRGYVLVNMGRERVEYQFISVSTVEEPDAEASTDAIFYLDSGSRELKRSL